MENRNKTNKADFKITFIAGTLGTGGAERQLYYLISSMKQADYQVSLICLTKNEFWEAKIIELGVNVEFVGFSRNRLKRLHQIYKVVKRIQPELIYSFHFYTNIYAGIVGLLCKIKTFGSIRSDGASEKRANGYLSWAHYFLPDVIIANSEHGLRNCKKIFFAKKSGVLPNVIDLEKFEYTQPQNEGPFRLVFVGRMEEQKQPFLFLSLVQLLVEKGLECEGAMYGDGSLKSSLIELKESNFSQLPVRIFEAHAKIEEVYKSADCLVVPSKYEGTPNVVLEAMASGLMVAALSFEGIETVIETGVSGIIAKDLENLAEEIILSIREGRISSLTKEARTTIENKFELKGQLFRFESLLEEHNENFSIAKNIF